MATDPRATSPIDVYVGQRVRTRRLSLNLSQGALASALGITFQQVQKYKKGTNRISASRLQRIAETLQVPAPFFFEDAPGSLVTAGEPSRDHTADSLKNFLSTADGRALVKAFVRINDAKLRRHVVKLVEAAAQMPATESHHGAPADRTVATAASRTAGGGA